MNNFFEYDSLKGILTLSTPEILLIKEFGALMDKDRNKTANDPTGINKTRAFREFTYIYLAISWKSPYRDYEEMDRHEAALEDARLTQEEFDDPTFRAACRKFQSLQESLRSLKMLRAAYSAVDKFTDYFMNVDPEERDPLTSKPIYKVKDIMAEISQLSKVNEELKILEGQVKKEMSEQTSLRSNATDGFIPEGM